MLDKKYFYTINSAIICGLIAHGFMFLNKISFHDDIGQLFGVGQTYGIGRWFLGIISEILNSTVGKYSMPWFDGLLSVLLIGISACFVVNLLEMQNVFSCILVGGMMEVFPAVAVTYLYMFTASAYFFAVLLTVASLYLTNHFRHGAWGVILFTCALGIYQAYLGLWLGIMLCMLLKKCISDDYDLKKLIKIVFKYFCVFVSGIILYLLNVKVFSMIKGLELTSYQGFNKLGEIWGAGILKGVLKGYLSFFSLIYSDNCGLSNSIIIRAIIAFCFVISILGSIYCIVKLMRDRMKQIICFLILLCFPLGVNVIYAICVTDNSNIYTIMLYPLVLVFIFPVFITELIMNKKRNVWSKKLLNLLSILLLVAGVYYCFLSNEAYLKLHFLQEQTTSYFTTLITQIKSCPGYGDELPIAFVGDKIEDLTLTEMAGFDNVQIAVAEWNLSEWINSYTFLQYMRYHNGFSPKLISQNEFEFSEKINQMPVYPDYGSIQVLDDVVIIKLTKLE